MQWLNWWRREYRSDVTVSLTLACPWQWTRVPRSGPPRAHVSSPQQTYFTLATKETATDTAQQTVPLHCRNVLHLTVFYLKQEMWLLTFICHHVLFFSGQEDISHSEELIQVLSGNQAEARGNTCPISRARLINPTPCSVYTLSPQWSPMSLCGTIMFGEMEEVYVTRAECCFIHQRNAVCRREDGQREGSLAQGLGSGTNMTSLRCNAIFY